MISLSLPRGPMVIQFVAAHPDDVEIACGGLMLALADRGDISAHIVTLTGSQTREAEARAAANAFLPGIHSSFVGLPDGRLPANWDAVKTALHDRARAIEADVVLVPRPDDAHQDHRMLGIIAPTVWRDALVLHYEIPKWDGDLSRPNAYLPVPVEHARRKVDLLLDIYASQSNRDWWDEEFFLGFMRVRGVECRSRYAEAFSALKSVIDVGPRL